ncbi:polyprenyl synthetase family protein [Leptospira ilyithenensis]|uniref:Polyprenyl synthetase family protein n=1 Tax=Leptospira ilyithenensis TaxID=2484901 RepID=A0A4V3JWN1_9LEPT|nr:polyprenyl synthetase family protein [Leptospira ilyithenensis]TGN06929.1 polyprenyl synthetase family protein [Leptospira ilyithenensis]
MPISLSLAKIISRVDKNLYSIIGEDLSVLKKIKSFVIESGGKRIRPLTHYLFCELLEYKGKDWADVGAVAELIHAASLLHDDVVDHASVRRGKPTVGARFGNKTAILAGDFLLACGIQRLNSLENPKLMTLFSRVLRDLSVSELIQMEWEKNPKITLKIYDSVIYGKTASLFGACTESAGVLAKRSEKENILLSDFGVRLGKLFQKKDDCLDYFTNSKDSGKEFLKDFKNGLFTYPILVLRDKANGKEKKEIHSLFAKDERTSVDDEKILSMLSDKQIKRILDDEFEKEKSYFLKFLSGYKDSEAKSLLVAQIEKFS